MAPTRRWWFLAAAAAIGCADEAQNVTFGTTRASLSPPALSTPERSLRAAASDGPLVTVSLTFDDTEGEQLDAAAVLEAHGLVGTFYVNSPRLHQSSAGAGDWLSVADVLTMQHRGHEMGGHTLSHPYLTSLSEPERRREVSRIAASCRGSASPKTLPPANTYRLRSTRSVNNAAPADDGGPPSAPDTAQTLLAWLDHTASCGGGYLPLIFHHVRPECSDSGAPESYCFDLPELDQLSQALASGKRCSDGARATRASSATASTWQR